VSLKTFVATRAPQAGDTNSLKSWQISGGGTALVVNFCEESAANPIFQVQVAINAYAAQDYSKPISPPNGGRWHIEVVSGTLNRACIDLV
jgi:hypothetical protein